MAEPDDRPGRSALRDLPRPSANDEVSGKAELRVVVRDPERRPLSASSIDHISAVTLPVRDMGQSVRFYRALGLAVSYGGAEAPFTTMHAGTSAINLRQGPDRAGQGSVRVILRVRGVDGLRDDLIAQGLSPTPLEDAEWGERYFEISDPDGFVISFAEEL
jgi:catechol 2,3-dioxygenase-like lactoylglutathione lyase family enzyme